MVYTVHEIEYSFIFHFNGKCYFSWPQTMPAISSIKGSAPSAVETGVVPYLFHILLLPRSLLLDVHASDSHERRCRLQFTGRRQSGEVFLHCFARQGLFCHVEFSVVFSCVITRNVWQMSPLAVSLLWHLRGERTGLTRHLEKRGAKRRQRELKTLFTKMCVPGSASHRVKSCSTFLCFIFLGLGLFFSPQK